MSVMVPICQADCRGKGLASWIVVGAGPPLGLLMVAKGGLAAAVACYGGGCSWPCG